ncbi:MAG TPA: hypothetical protein V6D13_11770 [Halomicronema sp.]
MKKFLCVAVMFLVGACTDERPYRSPIQSQSVPVAKVTPVKEVQCSGNMPEAIKEQFKDFRVAEASDFVPTIRESGSEFKQTLTCGIFTEDFNQDEKLDYAVLLVNQNSLEFRFAILINRGNGEFGTAALRNFKAPIDSKDGIIYTAMFLKPAGVAGAAERDNFPLKKGTDEQKSFVSKPAIELWRGLDTDVDGLPKSLEVGKLAYCSDLYHFDGEDKLKVSTVCD